MILAGSGHRARTLGTDYPPMQLRLVSFAQKVLREHQPQSVVSGMALGWDQALARAARREDIPYVAVVPFVGQESRWHSTDRAAYRDLLTTAERVVVVSENVVDFRQALMDRNEVMVDMADGVLGLWDGRKHGGTFNCLLYARDQGVRVHHLFQHWQDFSD